MAIDILALPAPAGALRNPAGTLPQTPGLRNRRAGLAAPAITPMHRVDRETIALPFAGSLAWRSDVRFARVGYRVTSN
jgi:hypothetical protein